MYTTSSLVAIPSFYPTRDLASASRQSSTHGSWPRRTNFQLERFVFVFEPKQDVFIRLKPVLLREWGSGVRSHGRNRYDLWHINTRSKASVPRLKKCARPKAASMQRATQQIAQRIIRPSARATFNAGVKRMFSAGAQQARRASGWRFFFVPCLLFPVLVH